MVSLPTTLIHADDKDNRVTDIVSPINVATTFRYDNNNLIAWNDRENYDFLETTPVYSRLAHPNATRLESIFSEILGGHAVIYSSGLAAYFATLTHYNPKKLFIGQSYHGCHGIADIFTRNNGMKQYPLDRISRPDVHDSSLVIYIHRCRSKRTHARAHPSPQHIKPSL